MVVFEHESNRQEPAREAHVTGIPVYVGQGSIDGRPQFTARLTDLLPGAFAQDIGALSPIKSECACGTPCSSPLAADTVIQTLMLVCTAEGWLTPIATLV